MPIPGPPVFDAETSQQLKDLVAKGAAGGLFFITTGLPGDVRDAQRQGVEFTDEPTQRPYGLEQASAIPPATASD